MFKSQDPGAEYMRIFKSQGPGDQDPGQQHPDARMTLTFQSHCKYKVLCLVILFEPSLYIYKGAGLNEIQSTLVLDSNTSLHFISLRERELNWSACQEALQTLSSLKEEAFF